MKNIKEILVNEALGPVNETNIDGKIRTLVKKGYEAYTVSPENPKKSRDGELMKEWITFEGDEGVAFFIARVLDIAKNEANRDSNKILKLVDKYVGKTN